MRKRWAVVGLAAAAVVLANVSPARPAKADTVSYAGTSTSGCTSSRSMIGTIALDGTVAVLRVYWHLTLNGSAGMEVAGGRWVVNNAWGPTTYYSVGAGITQDWWLRPYDGDLPDAEVVFIQQGTTGTATFVVSEPSGYLGCFSVDNVTITLTHYNNASGGGGGSGGIATPVPSGSPSPSPTLPAGTPDPSASPPAGWCGVPDYDPNVPGTGPWVPCVTPSPSPTPSPVSLGAYGGDWSCSTTTDPSNCYSNTFGTPHPALMELAVGRTYTIRWTGTAVGGTFNYFTPTLRYVSGGSAGTIAIVGKDGSCTFGTSSPITGFASSFWEASFGTTWYDTSQCYTLASSGTAQFRAGEWWETRFTITAMPGGAAQQWEVGFGTTFSCCTWTSTSMTVHVDVTGTGVPTPSPSASASAVAPSGFPSQPPATPPPNGGTGGFDVCDPQWIRAHGSQLCAERPTYSMAASSMDPSGFDALVSALQSKAPFGYAAQAVTALTEAAGNAQGADAPSCTTLPVWLGASTADAELCIPWDEVAGWSSGVRTVLLAMLTIGVGISLLIMANRAAKGGS